MKPPPFALARAESVEHAVGLLAEYGEEAKLLAGGQSLLPMLNLRLARPSVLIDIGRIPGLDAVEAQEDTVQVGALTTHHALERLPTDSSLAFSALSEAAGHIGHYPIRVRGTLGGSLAHADATSEWALMALVMDAVLLVRGPAGNRELMAAEFFEGFFNTALEPDEMITGVRFGRAGALTCLEEYARRRGDFAIVAAATSVTVEGRRCTSARIALGGVASMPVRLERAERLLAGTDIGGREAVDELVDEVAHTCSVEITPRSDNHGSEKYRRRLAAALVGHSLRRSLADRFEIVSTGGRRSAPPHG